MMITKLSIIMVTLLINMCFSNIAFSNTKVVIATIENSAEPMLEYKLSVELDDNKDIVAFVKSVYSGNNIVRGQTKRFPLGNMRMGVLVEKLGFKVLKYDPSFFSSHNGGVLPIYFAKNFISSKFSQNAYGRIDVELVRNGDEWRLYNSRGQFVDYIYIQVVKNMFGIPKGIGVIRSSLKFNKTKI